MAHISSPLGLWRGGRPAALLFSFAAFTSGCFASAPPRPTLDPNVSLEAIAAAEQRLIAAGSADKSSDPGTSLRLAELKTRMGERPKETLALATEARVVAYFQARKLAEGAYLARYWVPITRASIRGIATSPGSLNEAELLSALATLRAACDDRAGCLLDAFDYGTFVERDWSQATAYLLEWMPQTARTLNAVHPNNGTALLNNVKSEAMGNVLRRFGARARTPSEIEAFLDDLRERELRKREQEEEDAIAAKEEAREQKREKEREEQEKAELAAIEKAERDLEYEEEQAEKERIRKEFAASIDAKLQDLKDFQKKSNEDTLKAISQAYQARHEQIKRDRERTEKSLASQREAYQKEREARRADFEKAKAERETKRDRERADRERELQERQKKRAALREAEKHESPTPTVVGGVPSAAAATSTVSPSLQQASKPTYHGEGCRSYAELHKGADILAILYLCVKNVPSFGHRVSFVLENLTSSTFYDVSHGTGEVQFSGGEPHQVRAANWCARPKTAGGGLCTPLVQEVDSGNRSRTVRNVRMDGPIVRFALDDKSRGVDWATFGHIVVR